MLGKAMSEGIGLLKIELLDKSHEKGCENGLNIRNVNVPYVTL